MPPTCFEQLLVLEPLLQRDDVDGLALVVHLHQRAENRLVAQVVKDLGAVLEFLDALAHAFVGREQDAAQHALLGLGRMRRQAIHAGRGGGRAAGVRLARFKSARRLAPSLVTESIMRVPDEKKPANTNPIYSLLITGCSQDGKVARTRRTSWDADRLDFARRGRGCGSNHPSDLPTIDRLPQSQAQFLDDLLPMNRSAGLRPGATLIGTILNAPGRRPALQSQVHGPKARF